MSSNMEFKKSVEMFISDVVCDSMPPDQAEKEWNVSIRPTNYYKYINIILDLLNRREFICRQIEEHEDWEIREVIPHIFDVLEQTIFTINGVTINKK